MTLLGTTYGRHHRWTSVVRGQGLWAEWQSLLHPKWQVSEIETPTDVIVLWITVDFAASNAPLSAQEEKALDGPVVHIPSVGGAVVMAYNLQGIEWARPQQSRQSRKQGLRRRL